MWRSVKRSARCANCGWWTRRPADQVTSATFPRTPGIRSRIVVSWVLYLAIVPGIVAFLLWMRALRHDHAVEPRIGDHWTIEAKRCHPDEVFASARKYVRVEVVGVTDEAVELAACETTSDRSTDVEDHCETYPIEVDPIERAHVVALYDAGAIDGLRRPSDSLAVWLAAIAAWVGVLALWSLASWRHLRRTQRAAT